MDKFKDVYFSCDSFCSESTTTGKPSWEEKPSSHLLPPPETDSSRHKLVKKPDALHAPIPLSHPLLLQAQTAAQICLGELSPVQVLLEKEAAAAAAFAYATCRLHEASTLAIVALRHLISWSKEVTTATGRPQTDVSGLQIMLDTVLLDLHALRIIAGCAAETRCMLAESGLLRPLDELALPLGKPLSAKMTATMSTAIATTAMMATTAAALAPESPSTASVFYTFTRGATSQTSISMPYLSLASRPERLKIRNRRVSGRRTEFQYIPRGDIEERLRSSWGHMARAKAQLAEVAAAQAALAKLLEQHGNDDARSHEQRQAIAAARAAEEQEASAAIDDMVTVSLRAMEGQRVHLKEIKVLLKAATFHFSEIRRHRRVYRCFAGCNTVLRLITGPRDVSMQDASKVAVSASSRARVAKAEGGQQQRPVATAKEIGDLLQQALAACQQAKEATVDAEAIAQVANSQARLNKVPDVQQGL